MMIIQVLEVNLYFILLVIPLQIIFKWTINYFPINSIGVALIRRQICNLFTELICDLAPFNICSVTYGFTLFYPFRFSFFVIYFYFLEHSTLDLNQTSARAKIFFFLSPRKYPKQNQEFQTKCKTKTFLTV